MNRKKEETISKPDYRQTYQRGRLRVEFSPASSDYWLWDVKYFNGQRETYNCMITYKDLPRWTKRLREQNYELLYDENVKNVKKRKPAYSGRKRQA